MSRALSVRAIRWVVAGCTAYALIGGGVTLVGWFAGVPRLTDWLGSGIAMFPNTALAAVCSAVGLVLAWQESRWCTRAAGILGMFVAVLGGATLFEHLSGVDLGIDGMLVKVRWGFRAAMALGRMGPPASTTYTILGIALVLLASRRPRWRHIVPALGIAVCAVATLALVGYFYGANPLFAVARYTGIAMQTASILLALGLAIVGSVPECEPVKTLQEQSAGGVLARRSLPFVIVLPFVLGWLHVHGESAGWFDKPMGISMLILALIGIFSCLVWWWWTSALAKHEQALRRSEGLLSAVLKQSPVGLGVMDLKGKWVVTNRLMEEFKPAGIPSTVSERIWRWRAWDERGKEIPPEDWPGERALRGESVSPGLEMLYTDEGGQERWMRVSTAPLRDETGKMIGAVAIVEDVDAEKRTAEKLREAQRKLSAYATELEATVAERTAKLRESVNDLEAFSYSITHDMRAPLRAMGTFAQLLRDEISKSGEPGPGRDYCERIVVGAERMDKLIAGALKYAQTALKELPMQAVDVSKLVAGLLATYPNLDRGRTDIRIEEGLPVVLGDESLLTQCFSNLLGNAVKFVAPGVRPKIRVRSEVGNGTARIWVEDNGIGIPAHAQRRLFGMFEKLDTQYEGTGMGLAIVRKVVERMGGKVGVESEPGKGSRFWVELRVAPGKEDGAVESGNGGGGVVSNQSAVISDQ